GNLALTVSGDALVNNGANNVDLQASTIGGNLDVTTVGTAITDDGVVTVAGTSSFTAGAAAITLDAGNDFTGAVSASNTGNLITLNDANGIVLGDIGTDNSLTVTSSGAITQDTQGINVAVTTTLTPGAANDIILGTSGNDFGAIQIVNGNNVTLTDINALAIGGAGVSAISGELAILTGGDLTQTQAVTVTGETDIAVGANAITLTNAANNFTGAVSASNLGAGAGVDIALRDTDAIILGQITTPQDLLVQAGGAVTQTIDGVEVAGETAITAGANAVTLDAVNNDFNDIRIVSGTAVTLADRNAIDFDGGASDINGALVLTTNGAVTQGDEIDVLTTTTINANGGVITLTDAANNMQGLVNVLSGDTVSLANANGNAMLVGDIDSTGTLTLSSDTLNIDGIVQADTISVTGGSAGQLLSGQLTARAGDAAFTSAVTVDSATALVSALNGGVTFTQDVNADVADRSLTVNAPNGTVIFDATVGAAGATDLDTLIVNAGDTRFDGTVAVGLAGGAAGIFQINGDGGTVTVNNNVTSAVPIEWNDSVIVNGDRTIQTTVAGEDILITGQINATATTDDLVITTNAGDTTLRDDIGNVTRFASVDINGTNLYLGGDINTTNAGGGGSTGSVTLDSLTTVQLDDDVAITSTNAAGAISFPALQGGHSLTINGDNADITFAGTTQLTGLTVSASDTVDFAGVVSMPGSIAVTAAEAAADTIDVQNTIDSTTGSVTLVGPTEFNAAVSAGQDLSVTGVVALATGLITLTADNGDLTLNGNVTGAQNFALVATNGDLTVDGISTLGGASGTGTITVTAGGVATLGGDISTNDSQVSFINAPTVMLSRDVDINTSNAEANAGATGGGADIVFARAKAAPGAGDRLNVLGGGYDLTMDAGTAGDIYMDHVVDLTALTIDDIDAAVNFGADQVFVYGTMAIPGPVDIDADNAVGIVNSVVDDDIDIQAPAITIDESMVVTGSHTITLTSEGTAAATDADGDITIGELLASTFGKITISADDDLVFQAGGQIRTGGDVEVDVGTQGGVVRDITDTDGVALQTTKIIGRDIDLAVPNGGAVGAVGNVLEIDATRSLTVSAAGAGAVYITDTVDDLNITSVAGGSGAVALVAAQDMTIDEITTTGNATLTAGQAIIDGDAANVNVTADTLTISGGTTVGASGNPLDTTIATLDMSNVSGDTFIDESGALTVNSVTVGGDFNLTTDAAGDVTIADSGINAGLNAVRITTNSGDIFGTTDNGVAEITASDIILTATAGAIGGPAGVGALDVTTTGSHVEASTTGATHHIDIDNISAEDTTLVATTTGAGSNIIFDQSNGGDLEVILAQTATGAITISVDSADLTATEVTAGTGGGAHNISLSTVTAAGNINLGSVTADGDTVTLGAFGTGTISDANGPNTNVTASILTIDDAGSVGAQDNAINTDIATLNMGGTAIDGATFITEADDINLASVDVDGSFTLESVAGTITATDVDTSNDDVTLTAGAGVTVAFTGIDTATTGDVTITAGTTIGIGVLGIDAPDAVVTLAAVGNITGGGGAVNVNADRLNVTDAANVGTALTTAAALVTNIDSLDARNIDGDLFVFDSANFTAEYIQAGDDVALHADGTDLTIGRISAQGNVTLSANRNIIDGDAGADTGTVDIEAGGLTIGVAALDDIHNVGAVANPLETRVAILRVEDSRLSAGAAATTGLYIANEGDLEVEYGTNIGTAGQIDTFSLSTSGALTVSGGLNMVGDDADVIALTSTGGDLSVSAGGSAMATAGAGTITLTSSDDLHLDSDVVTSNAGTVNLSAGAAITDDGDVDSEITTGTLNILDAASIGSSTVALDTNVGTLDIGSATNAAVVSGPTYILEEGDITLNAVATEGAFTMTAGGAVTATSVSATDSAIALTAGTTMALGTVTAGTADVTITASGGAITDASGGETANVTGALVTMTANGNIGVAGAGDIDTAATALDISAAAVAGNIVIEEANDVELRALDTFDGDVTVTLATGDAEIDTIYAGTDTLGNVTLDVDQAAGQDVTDLDGDSSVTADDLTIQAQGNIGTSELLAINTTTGEYLDIDSITDGNIYMSESNDLTATAVDTADGSIWLSAGGALEAALVTAVDAGGNEEHDVTLLITATGDITLTDVTADDDLVVTTSATVGHTGDILVALADTAGAAGNDITLTASIGAINESGAGDGAADIVTAAGRVTLTAYDEIGAAGDADIDTTAAEIVAASTNAGAIVLSETDGADFLSVTTTDGAVTLTAAANSTATLVTAGGGADDDDVNITLTAGDLEVDTVGASTLGDVVITASTAAGQDIIDAVGDDALISGDDIELTAQGNIGTTGADLGTAATTLDVSSTTVGSIVISETDGVTLEDIDTADGLITITTGGDTDVQDVVSTNDDDANDITITATAGDIDLDTLTAGAAGDATVEATLGAITDAGADSVVTADVLSLRARDEIGVIGGNDINMTATTLSAVVTQAGDIAIDETNGLVITEATTADGAVRVDAAGEVTATLVQAGLHADDEANDVTIVTTVGDVLIDVIRAGDDVTLTATTGAINESGAGDAGLDIIANSGLATLTAQDEIAQAVGGGALETAVAQLNASSTTAGDIIVAEADGITLTDVDTVAGSITVTATAGDIVAQDVVAGGAGNITLSTTTSGNIEAGILNADGNTVNLSAAGAIAESAAADTITAATLNIDDAIAVGSGDAYLNTTVDTITLDGVSGDMWLSDADAIAIDVNTATANLLPGVLNVSTRAAGLVDIDSGANSNLVLGVINANAGADNVLISQDDTGAGGNILDGNAGQTNILAGTLTIDDAAGIGVADNALDTAVTNLALSNLSDDTYLLDAGALTITAADTVMNGSVDIRSTGTMTVTGVVGIDAADESVLLEAQGAVSDLDIRNNVSVSGTGTVDLLGGQDVLIGTAAASSTVTAVNGDVTVTGGRNVTLGGAGTAFDGVITTAGGTGSVKVNADGTVLVADTTGNASGINSGGWINIDPTTVTINDAAGLEADEYVTISATGVVTVAEGSRVETTDNDSWISIDSGSMVLSGNLTTPIAGGSEYVTLNADTTITDTTDGTTDISTLVLNITGGTAVGADAGADDVADDSWLDTDIATLNISNVTGAAYVLEDSVINANSVDLTGEFMLTNTAGNITATNITTLDTEVQLLSTAGSIVVGNIDAGAGTVDLDATAAAQTITDADNSTGVDITGGTVELNAHTGIGAAAGGVNGALEVDGTTITANNSDATGIFLNAVGSGGVAVTANAATAGDVAVYGNENVTLTDIDTASGNITSTVTGADIIATDVVAGTAGDITLTTTGSGNIEAGILNADGDEVTLTAAGAIIESAAADTITATTLDIDGATTVGSGDAFLNTTATTIELDGVSGDVWLSDADAIAIDANTATANLLPGALSVSTRAAGLVDIDSGANSNLVLGTINANAGADNVTISQDDTGTGGNILDGNGGQANVIASVLTIDDAAGTGVTDNPLDTTIATLNMSTISGATFLQEADDINLLAVDVDDDFTLQSVDGTITATNVDTSNDDVTLTAANGVAVGLTGINTTNTGDVTITAGTTIAIGVVGIDAPDAIVTLAAGGNITGGAAVNVNADRLNITDAANVGTALTLANALVTNIDTLDARNVDGNVFIFDTGDFTAEYVQAGDDVALNANGTHLTIGRIIAQGTVTLSAGEVIIDGDAGLGSTGTVDIEAGNLIIGVAGLGPINNVGTAANPLETRVSMLQIEDGRLTAGAAATTGLYIANEGDLVVDHGTNIGTNGQIDTFQLSASGSLTIDGGVNLVGNDADVITLTSTGGDLSIEAGLSSVAMGGAGTITLTSADDLHLDSDVVTAATGTVVLSAGGAITDDGDVDSEITTGTLNILDAATIGSSTVALDTNVTTLDIGSATNAPVVSGPTYILEEGDIDLNVVSTEGAFTLSAAGAVTATSVSATDSDVALTAGTSVELHTVTAGTGDVTVTADGGAITDGLVAETANVTGSLVTLTSTAAIGAAAADGDIDTDATSLNVSSTGTGDIVLDEADGVILLDIDNTDGSITIQTSGATTATDVATTGAANTDDITIEVTTGDVEMGAVSAGGLGDVDFTVTAGSITDVDDDSLISADDLTLQVQGGIGTTSDLAINTTVATLTDVDSTVGGDIYLNETNVLAVTDLDA
ncbi:MAG: hypothetical protein HON70_12900, partial [Lentisphaerae bacterium]|nr:hypothetical protein [Lentisphaerota bacterium]